MSDTQYGPRPGAQGSGQFPMTQTEWEEIEARRKKMTHTIWKQILRMQPEQLVTVPVGAKFLCVQVQHDLPCIWFSCDPTFDKINRTIHIARTGDKFNPTEFGTYLGTFQLYGGSFVGHVFEGAQ